MLKHFNAELDKALLIVEQALSYRNQQGYAFDEHTPYSELYDYTMNNGGPDRADVNAMIKSVEIDLKKVMELTTEVESFISSDLRRSRRNKSETVYQLSAAQDAVRTITSEVTKLLTGLVTIRRGLSRSRRTISARNVILRAIDLSSGLGAKLHNTIEILGPDIQQFDVINELFELVGQYLTNATDVLKKVLHSLNDAGLK